MLEAAAPLLNRTTSSTTVKRIIMRLGDLVGRPHAGAWLTREAFGALGALLPGADDEANREASTVLQELALGENALVIHDLPRALQGLRWKVVGTEDRATWRQFVADHLNESAERSSIAIAAFAGLRNLDPDGARTLLDKLASKVSPLRLAAIGCRWLADIGTPAPGCDRRMHRRCRARACERRRREVHVWRSGPHPIITSTAASPRRSRRWLGHARPILGERPISKRRASAGTRLPRQPSRAGSRAPPRVPTTQFCPTCDDASQWNGNRVEGSRTSLSSAIHVHRRHDRTRRTLRSHWRHVA